MSEVVSLSSDTFGPETANGAVVVDFYADWCGPCMKMAPTFKAAAEDYDGRVKFCKLNIDDNRSAAIENGVASIPTLFFYKDGTLVNRISGEMDRASLDSLLAEIL